MPDPHELQQEQTAVAGAFIERCSNQFEFFVQGLTIPGALGPAVFDDVMADFQRKTFRSLYASLHAVKNGTKPGKRRFWIERTKKAGKDHDIAACVIWLMAFPRRPLLVQVCAANSKQAGIVRDRAVEILHYNPWLNEFVEIVQYQIRNKTRWRDVRAVIEATGSAGAAQGDTPNLLILNELVHVDKWGVMETHMNNADGVPHGVVIISTNAGILGTKAHLWRQTAIENPDRWTTHIFSGKAPWIAQEDMNDAKKRDPIGTEYRRLWEGKWVSGTGGAVDEDSIGKCFQLDGPLLTPESGWQYLAGLDLGVSHDHAGVALIGVHSRLQKIKVAWIEGWQPSIPNDKGTLEVDCDLVEAACEQLHRQFRVGWFGYDPAAGGSFMAQRLRKKGVPMREMTFASAANLTEMAKAFVLSVKGGILTCYDDAEGRLRRDFGKFSIVHKPPSGYKLEAVSDEYGHADVGTALVICLPQALKMLGGFEGLLPEDTVAEIASNIQLTETEVAKMPDELRAIYEMEERPFRY